MGPIKLTPISSAHRHFGPRTSPGERRARSAHAAAAKENWASDATTRADFCDATYPASAVGAGLPAPS